METNESILTREIVAIDDRKKLGKLKEARIDCDSCAISHYIVSSPSTNSSRVLPFEKSLAIGDTFMTIKNREDLLPSSGDEAKQVIEHGFRLLGIEVFSKNGNRLGIVEGYEFEPIYGRVTKISLDGRKSFTSEEFMFFAPDFVFVDDGEATAQELRAGGKKDSEASEHKSVEAAKTSEEVVNAKESPETTDEKVIETTDLPKEEKDVPLANSSNSSKSGEDQVLKDFLLDAIVTDDVESKDGLFKIEKNTKLTKELIEKAAEHNALLLLTMSVEG